MPKTEKPFDLVGAIMAWEDGSLEPQDVLELFAYLIKTGKAWSLQGMYGRQAMAFIEAGWIDREGKILRSVDE